MKSQNKQTRSSNLGERVLNTFGKILDTLSDTKKESKEQQYADCIIYNEFGEVLLLHRTYNDDFASGKWGFPGGHVEEGEDPKTACEREVLEETNLTVIALPVIMKEVEGGKIHYFEALVQKENVLLNAEEHRSMEWVPANEVKDKDLIANLADYVDDLLKKTEWNSSELEEQWKTITTAFDQDLITEEEFFKARKQYLRLKANESMKTISKAFDEGLIDEAEFLKGRELFQKVG